MFAANLSDSAFRWLKSSFGVDELKAQLSTNLGGEMSKLECQFD